jgi:hypothetical protein
MYKLIQSQVNNQVARQFSSSKILSLSTISIVAVSDFRLEAQALQSLPPALSKRPKLSFPPEVQGLNPTAAHLN